MKNNNAAKKLVSDRKLTARRIGEALAAIRRLAAAEADVVAIDVAVSKLAVGERLLAHEVTAARVLAKKLAKHAAFVEAALEWGTR